MRGDLLKVEGMHEKEEIDRTHQPARLDAIWPILALALLFVWFYGRFAPHLYFVMDDYIETRYNLSKPLWTVIVDSFLRSGGRLAR